MLKIYLNIFLFLLIYSTHFSQSLNCDYCGKKIENSYISFEGKIYHESCYKNYVQIRCAECGQPIEGKYFIKDDKKYHELCFKQSVALRCDLCNNIIEEKFTTDYWGNNYHAAHLTKETQCNYCGRFIAGHLTRGGFIYNDGRAICGLCKLNSVESSAKAVTILHSVKNALQNINIKINYNNIELQLVDKDELLKTASENNSLTDPRGFAKYSYWETGNETTKREFTIYILKGMPQKEFEAVAAHELMHIWQYINSLKNLNRQLAEGSAEFASYQIMKNQSDDYSKYVVYKIETNQDPVYGEGFRRVKKIVDNNGMNYLLDYLRKSNNFPSGY